jgi:enterochelin esterase-like enzyme
MVGEDLVVGQRIGRRSHHHQQERCRHPENRESRAATKARDGRPHEQAAGQPGARHAQERLAVVPGQLLERERTRDARAERQQPGLPQQVQPAESGEDRGGGETHGRGPRAQGAKPVRRALAPALMCCWLLAGLYGALVYVHDYDLYRGFPPPHESRNIPHGHLKHVSFRSEALGQKREYLIYLPPGYSSAAAAGRRFPVLYLLHAPAGKGINYVLAGDLDVRVDTLLAGYRIHPFITVIPLGHAKLFGSDHEWANARAGRYEDFVLDTVRAVDSRWSTIRSRKARMIAGLSAGGYGATNIALHHLRVFGSFESWSGYYLQTPTYAFRGASRSLLFRNSPAEYLPSVAGQVRRLGLHAFLYQGLSDDVSAADMEEFAGSLRSDGAHVHTALYGGKHNWTLWRAHFSKMLRYASHVFAAGRR